MDLVLSDQKLTEIINNPVIKLFHHDEYYFIQTLDDDNCFTHPYDLLTEEDDTWGHYDIKYNVSEINHQPKYFYRSNIINKTEFLRTSETSEGYENRLEEFLKNIAYGIYETRIQYQKLFNDYNDQREISDKTILLVGKMVDYLGAHQCKIEHQTIYDIVNEVFYTNTDAKLKLQFSGHLYEKMFTTENANEIEKRISKGSKTYYEINNEIIIDTATNSLYIRKLRLDHYYEQAHGVQEVSEILYGTHENPITELKLPFEIDQSIIENDLFSIEIVAEEDQKEIRIDGEEGNINVSSFTYPFEYLIDTNAIAEVEEAIQINLNSYLEAIKDLNPEDEEYQRLTDKFEEMDVYLNDYIYNLKYYDIEQTSMKVKYDDEFIRQYLTKDKGTTYPINSLSLPKEFLMDAKNTDIHISVIPSEYTWEKEYTASFENPITSIDYREDLDIITHIENTKIKVYYNYNDKENKTFSSLTYQKDYYIDKKYNKITLIEPITMDCKIEFDVEYSKYILSEKDYEVKTTIDENTKEVISIDYILKKPINQEVLIGFKKIGREYLLQYFNPEGEGYYTISDIEDLDSQKQIILKTPITKKATIFASKNYDTNFNLNENIYNKETNTISLFRPLNTTSTVFYKRNSKAGGYLEIVFHYRLRELNSRFLSNLKPDWLTNDENDVNYIRNRPMWLDTITYEKLNDLNQKIAITADEILMESGDPEINFIYHNGESHYYEFFKKMIEEVLGFFDLDQDISDLNSRLKLIEEWVWAHKKWFEGCTFEGYEEFGTGLVQILENILAWLRRLQSQIENKTEIHIGPSAPIDSGVNVYKMWVNTNPENGNGLIYYKNFANNTWIPVSALWSASREEDAL